MVTFTFNEGAQNTLPYQPFTIWYGIRPACQQVKNSKLEKHFVNCGDFLCEVLLILASQRIEDVIGWELKTDSTKRGSPPSLVESCILAWVAGWYQLAH